MLEDHTFDYCFRAAPKEIHKRGAEVQSSTRVMNQSSFGGKKPKLEAGEMQMNWAALILTSFYFCSKCPNSESCGFFNTSKIQDLCTWSRDLLKCQRRSTQCLGNVLMTQFRASYTQKRFQMSQRWAWKTIQVTSAAHWTQCPVQE